MIVFLVIGIIVSFANPILGAVVIFPVCVIWVARKLEGLD